MRGRRWFTVPVALIVLAAALQAHDFWIEASSFHPAIGERVSFDLKVGQHVSGDSVARNPEKIERFFVRGPDGKDVDIVGRDGHAPAGLWRAPAGGFQIVGYLSKTTPIELEAAKFEAYLLEEGLTNVIEARKSRGESGAIGREIYSRSAKSILWCGPPSTDKDARGFDARIGVRLEIVPELDPTHLSSGKELALRVWFEDKPLAGVQVGFTAKSAPDEDVKLRTDAEGRVRFKVAHDGMQLVRAVWMQPAPKDSGADWDSIWGSLTLEIPASPVTVPASAPAK